jgi:predicted SnoaL-like aldol condensation-catalyzing enzyme
MTDTETATSIADLNKQTVLSLYDEFRIKKNVDAALDLVREDFIEHNPRNRTGRQALMDKFRDSPLLDAEGEIERVVAQNDLVVIHYQLVVHGTEPHGVAVVDIWRLEDRLIVEHWDVLQPVPAASENDNGMF